MTPVQLVEHYPVLFHMTQAGSWPAIRRIGLRTTTQLLDACDPDPDTRSAVLERPRTRSVELEHPVVGPVVIRDQLPLRLHNLRLTDTDVPGFLDALNTHVFLWTTPDRLDGLLAARSYRGRAHDVLVLDTERVVAAHADRIRLTALNTGATTFPSAPPRGRASFHTIADFDFDGRRRRRRLADTVVELCVLGGLDDVERYLIRVERRHGDHVEAIDVG